MGIAKNRRSFFGSMARRGFRKYVVWNWEEIPVHRYDEVHADIDSIEDLDDIYFS